MIILYMIALYILTACLLHITLKTVQKVYYTKKRLLSCPTESIQYDENIYLNLALSL